MSGIDTLRLLDEPFTFTQYRPLLPRQFIDEAKKCGLWLSEQELEALHRVRLLMPFYRLARDGREIANAHRRGEDAYHLAHWQPTSRADLTDARTHDRLHDAASEPFLARRRLKRPLGEWSYESSVYLYSHHQLTALPFLRQARPHLQLKRTKGDLVGRLDADRGSVGILRERGDGLRAAAVAATLLEPAYYARIFHRLSLPREEDFVAFDRWRRTRPLLRPLRILGVDATWIKDAAESLHWEAHRIPNSKVEEKRRPCRSSSQPSPRGAATRLLAPFTRGVHKLSRAQNRADLQEVRISAPHGLNEYETLDDARRGINGYVGRYHHRPHSGLDYRTPMEVRQTWEDLQKTAA